MRSPYNDVNFSQALYVKSTRAAEEGRFGRLLIRPVEAHDHDASCERRSSQDRRTDCR